MIQITEWYNRWILKVHANKNGLYGKLYVKTADNHEIIANGELLATDVWRLVARIQIIASGSAL